MAASLRLALFAEFLGTYLFQFFGGTEQQADHNGILLIVCIVITAKASGGMLNPAVAVGVLTAGEMPLGKCGLYCLVQVFGALMAALLAGSIHTECFPALDGSGKETCAARNAVAHWGVGNDPYNLGPGCRANYLSSDTLGPVFVYELLGTFVLVLTVLTTAVSKPGLGDLAPFAIGLSIFVVVGACGSLTGGFFNPARFLGPAIAFGCNFEWFWLVRGPGPRTWSLACARPRPAFALKLWFESRSGSTRWPRCSAAYSQVSPIVTSSSKRRTRPCSPMASSSRITLVRPRSVAEERAPARSASQPVDGNAPACLGLALVPFGSPRYPPARWKERTLCVIACRRLGRRM